MKRPQSGMPGTMAGIAATGYAGMESKRSCCYAADNHPACSRAAKRCVEVEVLNRYTLTLTRRPCI